MGWRCVHHLLLVGLTLLSVGCASVPGQGLNPQDPFETTNRRVSDFNDSVDRSLLKADGLLGIEEHRARPDAPASYTLGINGYMREADVIALVEAHGFRLVAKSEVNANPKDTADWPNGVWTLPPVLALKDKDRAKYEAIGESDRMTLRFVKP